MYRDRIAETRAKSEAARKLQQMMLAYHDFQQQNPGIYECDKQSRLTTWQSQRLQETHSDLYRQPNYSEGLDFLLSELYAPQDFSARDKDLERIFPKMVSLLPDSVLDTVSLLVELNLLTQKLDKALTDRLFDQLGCQEISEQHYCDAFRLCDNYALRKYQIELVSAAGCKLDRYARSTLIKFSLRLSEGPAEMAGLAALHNFISRGFKAFHTMTDIDRLMGILSHREMTILDNIFLEKNQPFHLTDRTA